MSDVEMEKIISLAKRRGFVFQGSEIYGGLAGTWDYGPMGVELKNNLKNLWWKKFVSERPDIYGIDAAILMNPNAWVASGHVSGFSDPIVECKNCKEKFRTDHLISDQSALKTVVKEWLKRSERVSKAIEDMPQSGPKELKVRYESLSNEIEKDESITQEQKIAFNQIYARAVEKAIKTNEEKIKKIDEQIAILDELLNSTNYIGLVMQDYLNRFEACPNCGAEESWDVPSSFNLMFETKIGATEDSSSKTYLRPETAGGIFTNFKNILDTFHPSLPFGIAQIGKAFRNEIAPRDFLFRVREFEQMEVEYFVKESDWQEYFEEWRILMNEWIEMIGLPKERVHELDVPKEDLAHYSKKTIDFEYDYPFGRKELYGLAYRTDFDLNAHAKESGVKLEYFDQESGERFVPHVIEPSLGIERTVLAILLSAYSEEKAPTAEGGEEERVVMKFRKEIAPIKVAILPLMRKGGMPEKAKEIFENLISEFVVQYDETASIGKRYRRQDEIGTPYCITVDQETLENETVTVRDRDTMEQDRVRIDTLKDYLRDKFNE